MKSQKSKVSISSTLKRKTLDNAKNDVPLWICAFIGEYCKGPLSLDEFDEIICILQMADRNNSEACHRILANKPDRRSGLRLQPMFDTDSLVNPIQRIPKVTFSLHQR
jgi:hypothetical protein